MASVHFRPPVEFAADFETASPPARPLRILCAEDHEQMGLLTKLVLEREGHYVEHVYDGQEALDRVRLNPAFFDLILTDHRMPCLSGLDLARHVRQANYRGAIIVHSSCVSEHEESAYRDHGVTTILRKPATVNQIVAAVNRVQPC